MTHLSLFSGIGGLGNAAVPKQFYPIFRAIAEELKTQEERRPL